MYSTFCWLVISWFSFFCRLRELLDSGESLCRGRIYEYFLTVVLRTFRDDSFKLLLFKLFSDPLRNRFSFMFNLALACHLFCSAGRLQFWDPGLREPRQYKRSSSAWSIAAASWRINFVAFCSKESAWNIDGFFESLLFHLPFFFCGSPAISTSLGGCVSSHLLFLRISVFSSAFTGTAAVLTKIAEVLTAAHSFLGESSWRDCSLC